MHYATSVLHCHGNPLLSNSPQHQWSRDLCQPWTMEWCRSDVCLTDTSLGNVSALRHTPGGIAVPEHMKSPTDQSAVNSNKINVRFKPKTTIFHTSTVSYKHFKCNWIKTLQQLWYPISCLQKSQKLVQNPVMYYPSFLFLTRPQDQHNNSISRCQIQWTLGLMAARHCSLGRVIKVCCSQARPV